MARVRCTRRTDRLPSLAALRVRPTHHPRSALQTQVITARSAVPLRAATGPEGSSEGPRKVGSSPNSRAAPPELARTAKVFHSERRLAAAPCPGGFSKGGRSPPLAL